MSKKKKLLPGEIAYDLIRQTHQEHPPIKLEPIASLFHATIATSELENDGYLVEVGNQMREIVINKDSIITRRRFTIAHEIGHIIINEYAASVDKKDSPVKIEKWCDNFATELLTPRKMFVDSAEKYIFERHTKTLAQLSDNFNVSLQMIMIRISEVTPITIVEVMQTEDNLSILRVLKSKLYPFHHQSLQALEYELIGPENRWVDRFQLNETITAIRDRSLNRGMIILIVPNSIKQLDQGSLCWDNFV